MWHLIGIPLAQASTILYAIARKNNDLTKVKIFQPLTTVIIIIIALLSFLSPDHDTKFSIIMTVALGVALIADWVLIDMDNPKVVTIGLGLFFIVITLYNIAVFTMTHLTKVDIITNAVMLIPCILLIHAIWKGAGNIAPVVAVYIALFSIFIAKSGSTLFTGEFSLVRALLLSIGGLFFYMGDAQMGIKLFSDYSDHGFWKFMLLIGPYLYSTGQVLIALSLSY